jgi:tryptophanase
MAVRHTVPMIRRVIDKALVSSGQLTEAHREELRSTLLSGRDNLKRTGAPANDATAGFEKAHSPEDLRLLAAVSHHDGIMDAVTAARYNPFEVDVDALALDLLTDSGTSKLYQNQIDVLTEWGGTISSIDTYAYAGSVARQQLDVAIRELFGGQFVHFPALQGRAAEFLLLNGLLSQGVLTRGSEILSNRPFDTTKGHIAANGMRVKALTELVDPRAYWNSGTMFMGNVDPDAMAAEYAASPAVKAFLITVTDNGGGGQPVSMENYNRVVDFAHEHGCIVWVDACRIFENALFIHLFEHGYGAKTLLEIVREMLAKADVATVSYKKIYSHTGGGILLNTESRIIGDALPRIGAEIQKLTTTFYGLGFNKGYCGLTGIELIEIITGLCEAMNPQRIADRIVQPIGIAARLKREYDLPVIGGGHALYIAADQVLPNVKKTDCPAEYLNALMMASTLVRGCGLGNFLYGGRRTNKRGEPELTTEVSMDSLRLAVPRNTYSSALLYELLSVTGRAYAKGLFNDLLGGFTPETYDDDGFDHFNAKFVPNDMAEFTSGAIALNAMMKSTLSRYDIMP